METWLFIDSGKCPPAFNMALDEALLDWHGEGKIPPVVRFYEWNPPTLSIGYFQKAEKEINLTQVQALGLGFVRRPTGGRAVLHEDELTYSVVVSEKHPSMPQSVTGAHRVISEGLLRGFQKLGFDASFSVPKTEEEKNVLKNPRSAVCFDAPSWYELVVEGKKIAGSAQTRQKQVILQHGSILLNLDEEKLFSLFKFPGEHVRERLMKSFRDKAVAINDLSRRKIGMNEVKDAFRKGFEEALQVRLEPYELSGEQMRYTEQLAREKYATDEWNFMR